MYLDRLLRAGKRATLTSTATVARLVPTAMRFATGAVCLVVVSPRMRMDVRAGIAKITSQSSSTRAAVRQVSG